MKKHWSRSCAPSRDELPIVGCAPATDTALLQGYIPTPEELAFAVFHSDVYQDFNTAALSFRGSEASFTLEDLQAWAATTTITEDQVIDYMVKYSNMSKAQLTGFLATTKDIEQRLFSKFGTPLREVYADEILLERYQSAFKELVSTITVSSNSAKNTVCGADYSLDCPGTRECYYGNNLDTYLDNCYQEVYNNAWIFLEASVLVTTAAGASMGALAAGVGAGPGAVIGGFVGISVGASGAILTLAYGNPQCRVDLASLCAICQARCIEP